MQVSTKLNEYQIWGEEEEERKEGGGSKDVMYLRGPALCPHGREPVPCMLMRANWSTPQSCPSNVVLQSHWTVVARVKNRGLGVLV